MTVPGAGVADAGAATAPGAGAGAAPATMATVVVSPMAGIVSATVSPGWTGNRVAGSTATVVVALGSTATIPSAGGAATGVATGRFAAAITVVNPNTEEAAIPVIMMRAPAATCGRLVRPCLVRPRFAAAGLADAALVRPVGAGRGATVVPTAPGATIAFEIPSGDGGAHGSCMAGTGCVRVMGRLIGAWPRRALMAAIRAAWSWSVIVALLFMVVSVVVIFVVVAIFVMVIFFTR